MGRAFVNDIATSVPPFDINLPFRDFANSVLRDPLKRSVFNKSVVRSHIDHRYSLLGPSSFDPGGFYSAGGFPDTAARMRLFERHAITLAEASISQLDLDSLRHKITHLIVGCCTGFYAPGLDIDLVRRLGLKASVERTVVGFMGCYAGITTLKLARHLVRSDPQAVVLVINVELCTLHLQAVDDVEQMLCFSLWGDGAAACVISAQERGLELLEFHTSAIPDSADQMSWRIGSDGFDITLSRRVPRTLAQALPERIDAVLGGRAANAIELWAVHPGGRSILDAVETAMELAGHSLENSREVLRRFGNMSSATVIFVLKRLLDQRRKGLGCALAFGPGLSAESMIFNAI